MKPRQPKNKMKPSSVDQTSKKKDQAKCFPSDLKFIYLIELATLNTSKHSNFLNRKDKALSIFFRIMRIWIASFLYELMLFHNNSLFCKKCIKREASFVLNIDRDLWKQRGSTCSRLELLNKAVILGLI